MSKAEAIRNSVRSFLRLNSLICYKGKLYYYKDARFRPLLLKGLNHKVLEGLYSAEYQLDLNASNVICFFLNEEIKASCDSSNIEDLKIVAKRLDIDLKKFDECLQELLSYHLQKEIRSLTLDQVKVTAIEKAAKANRISLSWPIKKLRSLRECNLLVA